MLLWLKTNLATILICAALAVIVALIIYRLIKNKKEGKTTCGCGCENCAMSGACHKNSKL